MIYFFSILIFLFLLIVFRNRMFYLLPGIKPLPVLMYHKVSKEKTDTLTINNDTLEEQFRYLKNKGYTPIFFKDLLKGLNHKQELPSKPIIISFDDGHQDNYELLYPLLLKFNFKATLFLAPFYFGKPASWYNCDEMIMSSETLKTMDPNIVEFGLHTNKHINLAHTKLADIEKDLKLCIRNLEELNISYTPVLAYPFGRHPRNIHAKKEFFNLLKSLDIKMGIRIADRINSFPFLHKYEIYRINIHGEDSLNRFKSRLKYGKIKLKF